MRLALVQMKQTMNPQENLNRAKRLVEDIGGCDVIVLPEAFAYPFGTDVIEADTQALLGELSQMASRKRAILIGGTIPEREGGKVYNTCYVFDESGDVLGKYRKIHLYDVNLPKLVTRESDKFEPGDAIKVIETSKGNIGLAVCYDIRFAEQFIALSEAGAELIVVPAAFSAKTGPLHWETLAKARALDSQCFVAACGIARNPANAFITYGHSCFVKPSGEVTASLGFDEGVLYCDYDPLEIERERAELPVLSARRPEVYGRENG